MMFNFANPPCKKSMDRSNEESLGSIIQTLWLFTSLLDTIHCLKYLFGGFVFFNFIKPPKLILTFLSISKR